MKKIRLVIVLVVVIAAVAVPALAKEPYYWRHRGPVVVTQGRYLNGDYQNGYYYQYQAPPIDVTGGIGIEELAAGTLLGAAGSLLGPAGTVGGAALGVLGVRSLRAKGARDAAAEAAKYPQEVREYYADYTGQKKWTVKGVQRTPAALPEWFGKDPDQPQQPAVAAPQVPPAPPAKPSAEP